MTAKEIPAEVREGYDPDEFLFPGAEFVDGTVEGALKAGLEAYPV